MSCGRNLQASDHQSEVRHPLCTFMMSPAVVLRLPVTDLVTLRCTERSLLVMVIEPLALATDLGLWR